jgi:hypothetical protein
LPIISCCHRHYCHTYYHLCHLLHHH